MPEGGYYDRFRMNPDLDEVARDPAAGNIDFSVGFRSVRSRRGSGLGAEFTTVPAHSAAVLHRSNACGPRCRCRSSRCALPGYGLVALTFFSYSVCDNDPYDEVSVAVVIRRPGATGSHALELLDSMRRRSFFAHVLALPVTTEIARVRGVHYQLPKWLADIDVKLDATATARIAGPGGRPDLSLSVPMPELTNVASQSHMGTSTMINRIDGEWHQTFVQTNALSFAQRLLPRNVGSCGTAAR